MVAMNVVYSLCAYPFGRLADRVSHPRLLGAGLAVLILADLALARGRSWPMLTLGVALWGVHMGMTQGLLATMVTDTAPAALRGTAFGLFNLVGGGAMLVASALAGWVWAHAGAGSTFYTGAAFAALALVATLVWRPSRPAHPEGTLRT
jgi:MFS family permease